MKHPISVYHFRESRTNSRYNPREEDMKEVEPSHKARRGINMLHKVHFLSELA